MMGTSPEMAAEFMVEKGCDILALNCGTGIDMKFAADTVRRYRSISGLPVMAQPNAGLPVSTWYRIAASANWSHSASTTMVPPRSCSGGR